MPKKWHILHTDLVDVLKKEIAWCRSNKIKNKDYEQGFVAGLQQAIYLTKKVAKILQRSSWLL